MPYSHLTCRPLRRRRTITDIPLSLFPRHEQIITITATTTATTIMYTGSDNASPSGTLISTETQVFTITATATSTNILPTSTFITSTVTPSTTAPFPSSSTAAGSAPAAPSPLTDTNTTGSSSGGGGGGGGDLNNNAGTIGLAVGLAILAALLVLSANKAYKYIVEKSKSKKVLSCRHSVTRQESPSLFWDRSRNNSGGNNNAAPLFRAAERSTANVDDAAARRENIKATIRHLGPREQSVEEAQHCLQKEEQQHGGGAPPSSAGGLLSFPAAANDRRHSAESSGWNSSIPSYYTHPRQTATWAEMFL